MYVCVILIHTHTYIYSYTCTQSPQCPDESKKDAGSRVEVPRMAPFPHCLGPVGSVIPACPLKGLSLLSSEPSAWPSVSGEEEQEAAGTPPLRDDLQTPGHSGTICRHQEGVYRFPGIYGQRSAGKDPHGSVSYERNHVRVAVEVWKTLRGAPEEELG